VSVRFSIFDSFDSATAPTRVRCSRRLDFAVPPRRPGSTTTTSRAPRHAVVGLPFARTSSSPAEPTDHPGCGSAAGQRAPRMTDAAGREIGALDSSPAAGSRRRRLRVSPYELGYLVCPRPGQGDLRRVPGRAHRRLAHRARNHRGTLLRDYDATLSVLPRQRPYPPLWYASSNTKTARGPASTGSNFVAGERRHAGGAVEEYWAAGTPTARRRPAERPTSRPPGRAGGHV